MPSITLERLQKYRVVTYGLRPGAAITTKEQAIAFVNGRGFVYFWPIKEVTLPSLWVAVAGDRPVPDEHDDPGHVTWGWKDELLGSRQWYYAKVLRKRATFIALNVAPYFYALSENYGAPEEDYLVQYQEGRLTWEAKTVYETILNEGALDTVSLRKLARMTSKTSDSPFNRALETLQADFKILPVGIAEAGAWRYAFVYECVHRHYPNLPEQARAIRQAEARRALAELYFRSVGAAQVRDLTLLFGWAKGAVEETLDALAQAKIIQGKMEVTGRPGEWAVLSELL
ncbi:MAG: winged helix DNA-binding domain-containing protein [Chloroflexi bacterium]|nr:winged helix DNA-binding domain-containing protein [Chloroflexota bacterium]